MEQLVEEAVRMRIFRLLGDISRIAGTMSRKASDGRYGQVVLLFDALDDSLSELDDALFQIKSSKASDDETILQ